MSSEPPRRPRRFHNAEEHLEAQRQELDRSSLDLSRPENQLYPHVSSVQHIPVELHQDIANWFRRLGERIEPSARYTPAAPIRPVTRVDLPAELVAWFERDGRRAAENIEIVLEEFRRSIEGADSR